MINLMTALVAYSQGDGNFNPVVKVSITPFDILFNDVALTDINFFNFNNLNGNSVIYNIRISVAKWYYTMRNIAAVILLCILIYVGIRMAISTIASEKASYKKMLVDWVTSLVLIFMIQYIILFTVNFNSILVNMLKTTYADGASKLTNALSTLAKASVKLNAVSIGATVVYCMFTIQTLALLISYINRMLKIAFLIIISPLITLTYSIDKMGDGKAQALGTWLKEFIFTILLQPFHCIIYLAFIDMALSIIDKGDKNTMAGCILAILCLRFTKEAEKLLGKIFSFSDYTKGASLEMGMAGAMLANRYAKNIGKGTRTAVNKIGNLKQSTDKFFRNAKIERMATMAYLSGKSSGLTYEQARDNAETEVTNKEADKLDKKNAKKYKINKNDSKYQDEVKAKADELVKTTGMTNQLATAMARKQIADKKRSEAKESNFKTKHKRAYNIVGYARRVKNAARQSETLKELRNVTRANVAMGAALAMGAGSYGAGGSLEQSIGLGVAGHKGVSEFMQASTGTLANSAQDVLESMNVTGQADVQNTMEQMQRMAPTLADNSDLKKYIDSLLGSIDKIISDVNAAQSAKNIVRDTVASEVKKNPNTSMNNIINQINSSLKNRSNTNAYADQLTSDSGFKASVSSVVQTQKYKELYDTTQQASDIGISPERFAAILSKRFKGASSGGFKASAEIVEDAKTKITTQDEADRIAEERTFEGLEDINTELDNQRTILQDAIRMAHLIGDKNEEDRLKKELDKITESQKAFAGAILDKKIKDLEEEVKKAKQELEDELRSIQGNDAVAISQRTTAIDNAKIKFKETLDEANLLMSQASSSESVHLQKYNDIESRSKVTFDSIRKYL